MKFLLVTMKFILATLSLATVTLAQNPLYPPILGNPPSGVAPLNGLFPSNPGSLYPPPGALPGGLTQLPGPGAYPNPASAGIPQSGLYPQQPAGFPQPYPQVSGNLLPSGGALPGLGGSLYPQPGVSLYPPSGGLYPSSGASLYPPAPSCDKKCKDQNFFLCLKMKEFCHSGIKQLIAKPACPQTCGACTPCPASRLECESETTCRDSSPALCKFMYKSKCNDFLSLEGASARQSCRRTCGQCRPCVAPPPIGKSKCDEDCKDERDDCPELASVMGYCINREYGDWMNWKCRLSCKVCKKCAVPPPLPPTTGVRPPLPPGYQNRKPEPTPDPDQVLAILTELYENETNGGGPVKKNSIAKKPSDNKPAAAGHYNPMQGVQRNCVPPNLYRQSLSQLCVSTHNYYRCLHNMPGLVIDPNLQKSAENYAIKIAFDGQAGFASLRPSEIGAFGVIHPEEGDLCRTPKLCGTKIITRGAILVNIMPGVDRQDNVGENLAWSSSRNRNFGIWQVVTGWYAEGLNYDFTQHEISNSSRHFTQIVWKDTQRVGCGVQKFRGDIYVVSHYGDAGNVQGLFQSNVFDTKQSVCKASCQAGKCQGNSGRYSDCACHPAAGFQLPVCTGHCVALCPRPSGFKGNWRERCSGGRKCSCKTYGYGVQGAQCF